MKHTYRYSSVGLTRQLAAFIPRGVKPNRPVSMHSARQKAHTHVLYWSQTNLTFSINVIKKRQNQKQKVKKRVNSVNSKSRSDGSGEVKREKE
jgi:hypothetical protein